MQEDLLLSVLIPVYNERDTVREVIGRVRSLPLRTQIVVVDDCSTDGTREVLRGLAETEKDLAIRFHPAARSPPGCRVGIPGIPEPFCIPALDEGQQRCH